MITITIQSATAWQARQEMLGLLRTTEVELPRVPVDAPSDFTTHNYDAEDTDTVVTEGSGGDVRDDIAAEPEQPRRGRGRPRKNPPTIDGESTLVSETVTPAPEEQQIDLEEVIAAKSAADMSGVEMTESLPDDAEPEGNVNAGKLAEQMENSRFGRVSETQPADPEKGWTHDDAKAVARQMYVRLGSLQQHELDERLHNNLQKFGVQRIKDLPVEKLEAFVRAVEGEVA